MYQTPLFGEPGYKKQSGAPVVGGPWTSACHFCSFFFLAPRRHSWGFWRNSVQFSSVQSLSRVPLFATPWNAARQASLSITDSRSLLKLMPIELVMPSSHFILCHPLILLPPNPSQPQGLFQSVNSSHEGAKVLEFQLQHQSFQWTPRADLLYDGLVGSPCSPRDSQEELGMCFDVSVWKSFWCKPQTMHWWEWAKVRWWARFLGSFTQKTLRCIWGGRRDPGSSDVPLLGSCREEAKTVHL